MTSKQKALAQRLERLEYKIDDQLIEIRECRKIIENALALLGKPAPLNIYTSSTTGEPPSCFQCGGVGMDVTAGCPGCGKFGPNTVKL